MIQNTLDRTLFKGTTPEIAQQNEKLLEQVALTEKYKTMSTFSAGIAHEIKNPLTAIKTFTQYLPQKMDDKEFLEKFSRIVGREVDRIDNMVHQLMDYSKPAPIEARPTNIHRLIDDLIELNSSKMIKPQIRVQKDYAPDVSIIAVDPNQIRQAFLNLIGNAIEAMPNGGTLTVTTDICKERSRPFPTTNNVIARNEMTKQSPSDCHSPENPNSANGARNDTGQALACNNEPGQAPTLPTSGREKNSNGQTNIVNPPSPQPIFTFDFLTITFTDTGTGIDPKDLPHIFDPFFSKKDMGTGLGLPITQAIIKNHGGKITVKSIVGQGTEFTIELPVGKETTV